MKEITRSNWSKFCRNFNSANQYRSANVSIIDRKNGESRLGSDLAFLGLGLDKKTRNIDGFQLYAGRWDPDKILEPILSIKQPSKVFLESDDKRRDSQLRILTKDGTEARIDLYGEKTPDRYHALVEKVAYSIFERRGYTIGNDMGDWFEAEKIVKEAETQLTS